MISQKDQVELKTIDRKWKRFMEDRKRNAFKHAAEGVTWLTMNEREDLLSRTLGILNKYQKTEKIYEIP